MPKQLSFLMDIDKGVGYRGCANTQVKHRESNTGRVKQITVPVFGLLNCCTPRQSYQLEFTYPSIKFKY